MLQFLKGTERESERTGYGITVGTVEVKKLL